MKKLIFVFSITVMLLSCGKKKEDFETTIQKTNKYVVSLEAIYPKDDSVSVVYKTAKYFQYEKAVGFKIKGSELVQKLNIDIPEGVKVDNVQLSISTNKEQSKITLKGIVILNNDKVVYNVSNLLLTNYFDLNPGLGLDLKERFSPLKFDGQYPPGLTGNINLEQILMK